MSATAPVGGLLRRLRATLALEWVTLATVVLGCVLAVASAVHPLLVVVAVVAVAAVALGSLRPRWALGVFLVSIPLEYGVEFEGNASLTITKAAGVLAFVSFAVYAARTRRTLRIDCSHWLVFALLVIGLASSTQSVAPVNGVLTTIRYLSWVLLYTLMTQFEADARLLRRYVWGLTLAAGIAGAWGSLDFLEGVTILATLPHGQQNDYAYMLAAILPLSAWLLRSGRVWQRTVVAVCVGCMVAGIVLSFSRSGWIAVAASVVVFAVLNRRQARGLFVVLLIGAVAAIAFISVDPAQVKHGENAKDAVAQANVDSRLGLFDGALHLVDQHPLLGVGPGNFGYYYYEITGAPSNAPALTAVHDTYLEVAAELGLPGFLAFMGFLGVIAWRLTVANRERLGPADLAPHVRAAMAAVLVGALTVSEEFFAPIWLIAGIASMLWGERASGSST